MKTREEGERARGRVRGEVHKERGDARVQRTREERARVEGTVPSSCASTAETNKRDAKQDKDTAVAQPHEHSDIAESGKNAQPSDQKNNFFEPFWRAHTPWRPLFFLCLFFFFFELF